jgi:uncharacterized protein (DUF2249 family)
MVGRGQVETLDVRRLPAGVQQETVVRTLDDLVAGEQLHIVSNHDPFVLRYQLELDRPGRFAWAYIEDGPNTWTTSITCLFGKS